MARRPVKDERRAQILDALFAVMSTHGAAGASVSEIAERAGIARGALHYFFESKDEITVALMRRLGERYHENLAAWLLRAESRIADDATRRAHAVRSLVRFHFSGDREEHARLLTVWIDFWGQAQSRRDVGVVVFDVQEGARAICRRAIVLQRPELAVLPDDVLRHAAATLLAIIEGGLLQWRVAASSPAPLHDAAFADSLALAADALVVRLAVPTPSLTRDAA